MAYVVGNVKERHKIIGSPTTIQIKTNSKQNSAQIYHALCCTISFDFYQNDGSCLIKMF
jgi:hypothetical protein